MPEPSVVIFFVSLISLWAVLALLIFKLVSYLNQKPHRNRLQGRVAASMERWVAGEGAHYFPCTMLVGCYYIDRLRIKENRVQTSNGYELSLHQAKKFYRSLMKWRVDEMAAPPRFEGYPAERTDNSQVIAFGCTKILWSDIDSIANSLGWSSREKVAA